VTATTTVDERLEVLTAQVERMAAELERQRFERERWTELSADLAPLARSALERASAELEFKDLELSGAELVGVLESLIRSLPALRRSLDQLEGLAELAGELSELSGPAFERLTEAFAELDERGYVSFAKGGIDVVDRVVTSFDEDDIEALGDNIVLILNTVKDMTQPEVMQMLRRTFTTVQSDEQAPAEPPGLFALLREMRSTEARRGLARLVRMLRSIGTQEQTTRQEIAS
jgi:uncharacterized protein YjgD (DUF1641 family)